MSQTNIQPPVHSHNPYHDTGFPLLVLDVQHRACSPFNEGFQVLHWHEEIQFVFVLKGIVHIRIYGEEFDLQTSDCMFINRSVLHQITEREDCHYHSYIIPPQMLGFFSGSVMEQQDVEKIVCDPSFTHLFLKSQNPLHHPTLEALAELDSLYFCTEKEAHHEYKLAIRLTQMWLCFVSIAASDKFLSPPNDRTGENKYNRIRTLISFVHTNYDRSLSTEEIAASAHISKTECLRCFRRFVGESPYQYLMKYRLHRSTSLLITTDLSITEIALNTGFHSASSYIRYFRKYYQKTPCQYRMEKKQG